MLSSMLAVLNIIAAFTLAGALAVIAIELPRLRRALIAARNREEMRDQAIGTLVPRLCDRNQLVRLAAIHGLAQAAQAMPDNRVRVAVVLASYLRAMSRDAELRRLAATEIRECLRELSVLNRAGSLTLDLSGCDFSGLVLEGLVLDRADLSSCNLSRCTLNGLSLRGTMLQGAVLREATISGVDLAGATLTRVIWDGARLASINGIPAEQVRRWQAEADRWSPSSSVASPFFMNMTRPDVDKSKLH